MSDAELRNYIRKHGRGEILSALFEGLTHFEVAEVLRSPAVGLTIKPMLLALTGEAFKAMGDNAHVVSARWEVEEVQGKAKPQRALGGREGFSQGFSIHYDVVFSARGSRPWKPIPPPEPDVYLSDEALLAWRGYHQLTLDDQSPATGLSDPT